MPKGVEANQLANATTGNQRSGQFNAGALQAQNTVVPALTNEINDPQGFGQEGLTAMNTASQEGVGGATAGAVGQGNLESARTRNAGGFQAADDAAAQSGQRQVSQNALGVQTANAGLKNAQQQAGIAGTEGLYNTDVNATNQALGLSNQALQGASTSSNEANQNTLGYVNAYLQAVSNASKSGATGG